MILPGKSLLALALGTSLLLGCAHTKTVKAGAAETPPAPAGPALGEVIHVNREQGYVILECTALPSTGEVIKVYRNQRDIGRVRVTGPVYNVFVACDALDGEVRQGDKVRR